MKNHRIFATLFLSIYFLSLVSFKVGAQEQLVQVQPKVGEWGHGLCTLSFVADIRSKCKAAGGTFHGLSSIPVCSGADFTAFSRLEPVEHTHEFVKHRYPNCSANLPVFSGWGVETDDPFCSNGPKYKLGVEIENRGNVEVLRDDGGACINYGIVRSRTVECAKGSFRRGSGDNTRCYKVLKEDKNCTTGGGVIGQPCDIRTGAKYRYETDFSYGEFTFTRNYHSLNLVDVGFGIGWHNQYLKRLSVSNDVLAVYEGTGRGELWRKENGVWVGDADSDYLITESASGYTVTLKRGDVHEYDISGRLLSETDTQGKVKTYEYDAEDRLIRVTNHYQQSITFEYSEDGKNHIVKVTDAQGVEYGYEYDANDNLTAVVYPDGDTDPLNNPKRIYHYENTDFPNHITGIINANGERYATFAYDTNGKAIESALAPTTNPVGQQRVQLNYQEAN